MFDQTEGLKAHERWSHNPAVPVFAPPAPPVPETPDATVLRLLVEMELVTADQVRVLRELVGGAR